MNARPSRRMSVRALSGAALMAGVATAVLAAPAAAANSGNGAAVARVGTVLRVDSPHRQITLDTGRSAMTTVRLAAGGTVLVAGHRRGLSSLHLGDTVSVTLTSARIAKSLRLLTPILPPNQVTTGAVWSVDATSGQLRIRISDALLLVTSSPSTRVFRTDTLGTVALLEKGDAVQVQGVRQPDGSVAAAVIVATPHS